MLAEGDWLLITIGRDVFYRENRHCKESNANARHMHYWDQMLHAFLAWSNSPRDDLGGSFVAFLYLLTLVNVPGGDGGKSISLFYRWFLDPLPNHNSLSMREKA